MNHSTIRSSTSTIMTTGYILTHFDVIVPCICAYICLHPADRTIHVLLLGLHTIILSQHPTLISKHSTILVSRVVTYNTYNKDEVDMTNNNTSTDDRIRLILSLHHQGQQCEMMNKGNLNNSMLTPGIVVSELNFV
jgi:hypothetical protein